MFIMAFAASPRKGGNTDILLDEVIHGLRSGGADVEKFRTHELDIQPCTGCGKCETLGRCVIKDKFQEIYDQLVACNGVVFASPLYFMNVPARAKALIDRCQAFWTAKYFLERDLFRGRKRPGMLISCSGAKFGPGGSFLFRGIEDTMTYVFDVLGLTMLDSLLFTRINAKGEIAGNADALEQARKRGFEMAKFIQNTGV